MYKLVAIDMDGTLLNSKKVISERNHSAIQEAKKNGVKIVLATGRPMDGIKNFLTELNLLEKGDYAVAFNGALVQDSHSGAVLAKKGLALKDLEYLFNLSKKLDVNIHSLTPSSCITPKHSKYSQLEADLNGIPLEIVDFNKITDDTEIIKVMFIDEEKILDRVLSDLPEDIYEKYTIVRSAPFFLEFLNKEVNKGVGVETLATSLGIKKEEVICIGDAGNDIHMVEYAGLGVAMSNAFPELKDVADYITFSNDEDGVAHVIDKFILKK